MNYNDTDSIALDRNTSKQYLNSLYGTVVNTVCKKYITVIVDKEPAIVFVDKIQVVTKSSTSNRAEITLQSGDVLYCDTSYRDVITRLLK